jgi:hypothetical protein
VSPSHHGRHGEQGLFDAFPPAYGQDRNLHWCAESDKDGIRGGQGGSGSCKDPTRACQARQKATPNKVEYTVARSMVSSTSFLNRSRLSTFVSEPPATPPPPNFEPTRFYRRN